MASKQEKGIEPAGRGERRSPGLFGDWEREMDRFFGPWPRLRPFAAWPAWAPRVEAFTPQIDVFEREGRLVVRADVPGMKREDIDVSLEGELLTIRGQRKEESEVKEKGYYRSERSFGEFARTVGVPEGTKADDIQATYKDGVLEVTLPLPVAAKASKAKVPVK